jgi:N-ethylmaleimide reductase
VSASATPAVSPTHSPSRALSKEEISTIIGEYRTAAQVAADAGFDGVEIHGAHGYLLDQFLHDGVNARTDEYGGEVEGRSRLLFEVLDSVLSVLPASRVALRLSPFSNIFGVKDSDPFTLFKHVFQRLAPYKLVYLSLTEPVWGSRQQGPPHMESRLNELLPFAPPGTAILRTGGYTKQPAEQVLSSGGAQLIGFGSAFITNPDLPERLRLDKPLNAYDNDAGFYGGGAELYTTHPTWPQQAAEAWVEEHRGKANL